MLNDENTIYCPLGDTTCFYYGIDGQCRLEDIEGLDPYKECDLFYEYDDTDK